LHRPSFCFWDPALFLMVFIFIWNSYYLFIDWLGYLAFVNATFLSSGTWLVLSPLHSCFLNNTQHWYVVGYREVFVERIGYFLQYFCEILSVVLLFR
jgi:hypothetical protein